MVLASVGPGALALLWLCWPQRVAVSGTDDRAGIAGTDAAVVARGDRSAPAPGPTPGVDRVLTATAPSPTRLRVFLPDGTTPAVGATVAVWDQRGQELLSSPSSSFDGPPFRSFTNATDADGCYSLGLRTAPFFVVADRDGLSMLATFPAGCTDAVVVLAPAVRLPVHVTDTAGHPLPGVGVQLTDLHAVARRPVMVHTDAAGMAVLHGMRRGADGPSATVGATLVGREVSKPVSLHAAQEPVELVLGDVGWLEVIVRSDQPGFGAEFMGAMGRGAIPFVFAPGQDRARAPVATGGRFQLQAWGSGQSMERHDVPGPAAPDEVVRVTFDLRRCRVTGVLPGVRGRDCLAVGLADGNARQVVFTPAADGSFAVTMPRLSGPAVFAVIAGDRVAGGAADFASAEHDAGTLLLGERPRLGVLEVRDESAALQLAEPRLLALLLPGRARVVATATAAASAALVTFRAVPQFGVEVLGLPGLSGVELDASTLYCYATPAAAVVGGDAVTTVQLARGGAVTVVLGEGGAGAAHEVWLQRPGSSTVATGGAARTVRDAVRYPMLPPGDYEVHVRDAQVLDGAFTVRAGGEQEVRVRLLPR